MSIGLPGGAESKNMGYLRYIQRIGTAILLMAMVACILEGNDEQNARREYLDGLDKSGKINKGDLPQTIAGASLTYQNARLICEYEKLAAKDVYRTICHAAVLQKDGTWRKAVDIEPGVTIAWNDPASADIRFVDDNRKCEISADQLRQSCDVRVTSPNGIAEPKIVLDILAVDKPKRSEEATVTLSVSVGIAAGLVPSIDYEYAAIDFSDPKDTNLGSFNIAPLDTTYLGIDQKLGFQLKEFVLKDVALPIDTHNFCARPDPADPKNPKKFRLFFTVGNQVFFYRIDEDKPDNNRAMLYAGSQNTNNTDLNAQLHRTRYYFGYAKAVAFKMLMTCDDDYVYVMPSSTKKLFRLTDNGSIDELKINDADVLVEPTELVLDKTNRETLYVLDAMNFSIIKLIKTKSESYQASILCSKNDWNGKIQKPVAMDLSAEGKFYISDRLAKSIFEVKPTCTFTAFAETDEFRPHRIHAIRSSTSLPLVYYSESSASESNLKMSRISKIENNVIVVLHQGSFDAGSVIYYQNKLYFEENEIVKSLDLKSASIETLSTATPTKDLQFLKPLALTYDKDGVIYFIDGVTKTIRRIVGQDENEVIKFENNQEAKFDSLVDLAISSTGIIYIVDKIAKQIKRAVPQNVSKTLYKFAPIHLSVGSPIGEFMMPQSIEIINDKEFLISESELNRVLKLTFEGDEGTLDEFTYKTNVGFIKYPMGISYVKNGDIFIADKDNQRVVKINKNGELKTIAGKPPIDDFSNLPMPKFDPIDVRHPALEASLSDPKSIAVDKQGNIYLTELYETSGNSQRTQNGTRLKLIDAPSPTEGNQRMISSLFGAVPQRDCGARLAKIESKEGIHKAFKTATSVICNGKINDVAVRDTCDASDPKKRQIRIAIAQEFGDGGNIVEFIRSCPQK